MDVTRPHARRTSRLQGLSRHLSLILGRRPAQARAARLLLSVNKEALSLYLPWVSEGAKASGSGNTGCRIPSVECLETMVADGWGGASAGWDKATPLQ